MPECHHGLVLLVILSSRLLILTGWPADAGLHRYPQLAHVVLYAAYGNGVVTLSRLRELDSSTEKLGDGSVRRPLKVLLSLRYRWIMPAIISG